MTTAIHPTLEAVTVVANERVTTGVGLLILEAPVTARRTAPGQFVHLRIGRDTSELLRRPFSVHRASGTRIEILYQVLGAGTARLALVEPGDRSLDVVGPLGRGWDIPVDATHALLVTGGLGAAPMGMLAEALAGRGVAAVVAMGAPTATRLVARSLFEDVTRRVEVATDDGSSGTRGFVTAVSDRLLREERFDVVYVCGPEAMQRIVADQARAASVACQVSLERLMACGIGACLSCVVTTVTGQKRACVDGPVFDAEEVVWNASEIPPKH
ncbi:MAG: dihydroorotate dehydrogenase electron transfer subunit [Coriobacteriia bacterium]|nr:dihydroorotate dehydrogenase electron transfer subunit [Coriobacteriia bacterium]